ncbi:MAG: PQQ-binding-like beta-propeller repeat protein [Planctomycetaceae bacterium]|nr:PQQ-binding-like beta-propeller repeat protein [Planctomycetaceae bacterium]
MKFPIAILALILLGTAAPAETPTAPAPLGSPKFVPTIDAPVGWRGDGTGRYPGATPPTKWERRRSGNGYAASGIAWMARLPNWGVSCPIVVGERIFLTAEPNDLLCLEKASGRILWIRSNMEFEGVPAEERKANPAYAEKLDPLLGELAKLNGDVAEHLNGQLGGTLASGNAAVSGPQQKKRDVEKKLQEAMASIDKKMYTHNWAQAVFGYSGATPVSDGKRVFAFFTNGITACYDLNGARKWISRGSGDGSEHGNFASPVLCGNRLVVWANEMRGYDADTGKLAFTAPAKSFNTYGSMFRIPVGGEWVAGFQSGYFVRVRDGQPIWTPQQFGDAVSTPIVEGGMIFAWMGYPIAGGDTHPFKGFRIPAAADGKLSAGPAFKMEWGPDELVVDKKKNPFDRGFVASPLFHDGLIYQVTEGGGLFVNDAATGEMVYRKVLPMKPKTEYWNWAGVSASPTSAGKYLYLMDNQGLTIVLQPGRVYKEIAQNQLDELKGDNKAQEQNVSTPVFEGGRMYYRTPGYLYCIGQ